MRPVTPTPAVWSPIRLLLGKTRNHGRARVHVVVCVVCQVVKTKPGLFVVGPDETVTITARAAADAHPVGLGAAGFHAHSCLDARNHVGSRRVAAASAGQRLGA